MICMHFLEKIIIKLRWLWMTGKEAGADLEIEIKRRKKETDQDLKRREIDQNQERREIDLNQERKEIDPGPKRDVVDLRKEKGIALKTDLPDQNPERRKDLDLGKEERADQDLQRRARM